MRGGFGASTTSPTPMPRCCSRPSSCSRARLRLPLFAGRSQRHPQRRRHLFQPGEALPSGDQLAARRAAWPTRSPRRRWRPPTPTRSRSATPGRSATALGLTADAMWTEYHDIPYRFRFNSTLDANGNPMAARRFPDFPATARMWLGDGEASYKGINLGFRVRAAEGRAAGVLHAIEGRGERPRRRRRVPPRRRQLSGRLRRPTRDQCQLARPASAAPASARSTPTPAIASPSVASTPRRGTSRWRACSATTRRFPYNKLDPNLDDTNHDGFSGDLAPGVSHVNSGRGASFSQFDARVSKDFVFAGNLGVELIAEVFNLFDEKNPASLRPLRRGARLRRRSAAGRAAPGAAGGADPLLAARRGRVALPLAPAPTAPGNRRGPPCLRGAAGRVRTGEGRSGLRIPRCAPRRYGSSCSASGPAG